MASEVTEYSSHDDAFQSSFFGFRTKIKKVYGETSVPVCLELHTTADYTIEPSPFGDFILIAYSYSTSVQCNVLYRRLV